MPVASHPGFTLWRRGPRRPPQIEGAAADVLAWFHDGGPRRRQRRSGGTGRLAALKMPWSWTVWVRIPPPAQRSPTARAVGLRRQGLNAPVPAGTRYRQIARRDEA